MFNPFFIFATGIEGSCPTIGHRRTRVDQMAKSRHYELWRRDFDLVEELGISVLRYGPPLHRTFLAPDHYDWDFADATYSDLRRRDIVPIADLCHFGVPDWIGDFQNPDFPDLFAAYARAFATRFPWVQLYTPVNEIGGSPAGSSNGISCRRVAISRFLSSALFGWSILVSEKLPCNAGYP